MNSPMLQEIERQIENINRSIAWIRKNKPALFNQRFISLVEERRKLRTLANAERNNPSIAAFGQSQVGKSYLMNCILQNNSTPFMVEGPDRDYNFVDEINPIGEGQEATGVVTRFSSYNRADDAYCPQYPIRMKVLSLRDVINILCDTYFNEFDDYTSASGDDIAAVLTALQEKYASGKPLSSPVLTADDMLDIKYYFKKHINNGQVYSSQTSFFDTLALLIDKVPTADYTDIFSILWNKEQEYTNLFERAVDVLQRLQFSEYIYLPLSALLHGGKREDTIMSVSCLKLLFTPVEKQYTTSAYRCQGDTCSSLGTYTKSELCMVCSEIIIKIGEAFLSTTGTFDDTMLSPHSKALLPQGTVQLEILRTTDLLDFPGARARGNMLLNQIDDHDNLLYTILRGKVAYLFNKYNEEQNINILLFCHHHKNVETPQMWQLLDEWVKEYVGDTPEKRHAYIKKIGIAPLFHIGTMFNLNLETPDNRTVGMNDESICSRWTGRFKEKLIDECFRRAAWVSNWDGDGQPFQNCYMLRDFKFSTNIYRGWDKDKKEQALIIDEDYYNRMRRLFMESNREYHLFADAEVAWDVAATCNNDGALYILYKLTQLAQRIDSAREQQIEERLCAVRDSVYSIMREYYQSTEKDKILDENIHKARGVLREMDFACNSDNYFFGHLLQALQVSEKNCYNMVHDILHSPNLSGDVHTLNEYEIIRKSCMLDSISGDDEKWEAIITTYGLGDRRAAERYLERKGVDSSRLFAGTYRKKLNSYVIAQRVLDTWSSTIQSVDFLNAFTGNDTFDATVMSTLVGEYVSTAETLSLMEKMATAIKDYVDVTDVHTANESLLADTLATIINNFVLDFGYRWLAEEARQEARNIFAGSNIPNFEYIDKDLPIAVDESSLTALFDDISADNGRLLPSFDDNYNRWMDYMFISFVAHLGVQHFDHEANAALEELLTEIKRP